MKGFSARPKGMSGGSKGPTVVKPGYGMKHQLRKGTMYPGMDTNETGISDQMSDYARMAAAGGMSS